MADTSNLAVSWHDRSWIPNLNQDNIMDYFSQRSNPFYDRTCNNEVIRMQRADPSHLLNMTGIEYSLYLVQEPILYVIRKVHRQSPDKVVPLANYYILGGVVYQCPDLHAVINSRLLSSLHLVHQAFEEGELMPVCYITHSQLYHMLDIHPVKDIIGNFQENLDIEQSVKVKDEPSDTQRKRVDGLLLELVKQFPPKVIQPKEEAKPQSVGGGVTVRGGDAKSGGSPMSVARQPTANNNDSKLPDNKRKKLTQL